MAPPQNSGLRSEKKSKNRGAINKIAMKSGVCLRDSCSSKTHYFHLPLKFKSFVCPLFQKFTILLLSKYQKNPQLDQTCAQIAFLILLPSLLNQPFMISKTMLFPADVHLPYTKSLLSPRCCPWTARHFYLS